MSLSFVQLNIESNYHLDKFEEILAQNHDVVTVQEVFLTNLQELAPKHGYNYVFAPCVILNSPKGKFAPLGKWGVAILTKHLINSQTEDYYYGSRAEVVPVIDPPQIFPRPLVSITIEVQGKSYTFATTHFTWAMPEEADKVQKEDLTKLVTILKKLPPLVLSGDFNAPRGGLVQSTLAKMYNYYIPQEVTTTIDNNLHRAAPLYLVIDHLFASSQYQITNVSVQDGFSDHCAIFAQIERITT